MPRSVRNFWIELNIDGRKTCVGTGPRSKDGGFSCAIHIREEGGISNKMLKIQGHYTQNKNKLSAKLINDCKLINEISLEVFRNKPKNEAPKQEETILKLPELRREPALLPHRDETFWGITNKNNEE